MSLFNICAGYVACALIFATISAAVLAWRDNEAAMDGVPVAALMWPLHVAAIFGMAVGYGARALLRRKGRAS